MKKNIFRSILILGIILGLGYATFISRQNKIQRILVRGQQFKAEIADTPQKMTLGLGERDALCEQCGMLFVFPEKETPSFWMKGMRFSLDIIWFDSEDGQIVHIEKSIPADSKEIYASPEKADRVLEINAGMAEKHGIKVGDTVTLEK